MYSSHFSVPGAGRGVNPPSRVRDPEDEGVTMCPVSCGPLEESGMKISNKMCSGKYVKIRTLYLIMLSPFHRSSGRQLSCPLNNPCATVLHLPDIILIICMCIYVYVCMCVCVCVCVCIHSTCLCPPLGHDLLEGSPFC